jgi:peroxiredoxin
MFLGGCRNKPAITNNEPIDFRLDTLGHDRFYLNQYRGKNVVIVFWSTWCIPCKSELIALKAFVADIQFKDVTFAAVCNDPENLDDVKKIVQTLGFNYPVLLDTDAKVANKFNVSAVPTALIIDREGKISLRTEGYAPEIMEQIKEHLLALENVK